MENYGMRAMPMGARDPLVNDVSDIAFGPRTYPNCACGCPRSDRLKCLPDPIKPSAFIA